MTSKEYIEYGMEKTLAEYRNIYPCFGSSELCNGECERNDDRLCYEDCVTLRNKIRKENGDSFGKYDF